MTLEFSDEDVRIIEEAITYWLDGGDESYGLHLASLVIQRYKEQGENE